MTALDTLDGAAAPQEIFTGRPRPARPGIAATTLVFAARALRKIKRTPVQLFDIAVHPVVFTLMFTYLFGGAIGGSTGRYLGYLVPGILVMTLLVTTGTSGAALSLDIAGGVYDRFRTMAIRPVAMLAGALLADLVRYALATAVVVGLGLALGFRPAGDAPGVAAAVALVLIFCAGLSWVWTALALVMRSPGAVLGVTQAVLYPLSFFSNIFIAPATLPGWLRAFVDVNPASHLVTAVRGLMAGTVPGGQILWLALACLILAGIFAPLSLRLLRDR